MLPSKASSTLIRWLQKSRHEKLWNSFNIYASTHESRFSFLSRMARGFVEYQMQALISLLVFVVDQYFWDVVLTDDSLIEISILTIDKLDIRRHSVFNWIFSRNQNEWLQFGTRSGRSETCGRKTEIFARFFLGMFLGMSFVGQS